MKATETLKRLAEKGFSNGSDQTSAAQGGTIGQVTEGKCLPATARGIRQACQMLAKQMCADGVDEKRAKDEFLRGCGTTDIETARTWRGIPESIRQLLLGNTFCPNCGTASFASGYSLRMRDGSVLIEGRCATCGAEIARLRD